MGGAVAGKGSRFGRHCEDKPMEGMGGMGGIDPRMSAAYYSGRTLRQTLGLGGAIVVPSDSPAAVPFVSVCALGSRPR